MRDTRVSTYCFVAACSAPAGSAAKVSWTGERATSLWDCGRYLSIDVLFCRCLQRPSRIPGKHKWSGEGVTGA